MEAAKHACIPLHTGEEAVGSPQYQEHVLCEGEQSVAKVKLLGALDICLYVRGGGGGGRSKLKKKTNLLMMLSSRVFTTICCDIIITLFEMCLKDIDPKPPFLKK